MLPKSIDFREWADNYAKHVTADILKSIYDNTRSMDPEWRRFVAVNLVSVFLGAVLYSTLTEECALNTSKEEQADFVMENFGKLKVQIQEAVSASFQGAMQSYSGKQVEYYCQVKTVPQPISNKVN